MRDDLYKDLYGEENDGNWYHIIPLAFLVSIVPLIVYGKAMQLTGDYFKYWTGTNQSLDFFSYYKALWIIVGTIAALIFFGVKVFSKSIKVEKNIIYIPIALYSLLIILSTIFSDFKQIALWGFVERYEGMIILLCYMVILVVTINLVNSKTTIKAILISLICSAVIIGLIGIMQYFGHDIYKTMTMKKLILPGTLQNMAGKLKFQFGDKIIYSSLYHYNYVGSYMAMLFPLTFTLTLLVKNKFYKVILALVALLMFLNLILCHSRAGIIGGMVAMAVLIITLRKYILRNWKVTISILIIALVGAIGFNTYSKGMLKDRIASLFTDAESLAKKSDSVILKDVVSKDKTLEIVYSDKTLKIESNNGNIGFKDASDKVINSDINKQNGQVIFKDDKYKDFEISIKDFSTTSSKKYTMEVNRANLKMPFMVYNDQFTFVNPKGESIELKPVEKWGFEGKETLGSARGYIWSRSIPMLKHTIVLGNGPDTFASKFPQDDYIGKFIAYYGNSSMLVDKPHNLYLQIGLNIGVVALVAFLIMVAIYFISSIRLYFKNDFEDFFSIVGLAIFTAVFGYLGAGVFNDSVVSVAPVFWVLLGMGVTINNMILTDKNLESKG